MVLYWEIINLCNLESLEYIPPTMAFLGALDSIEENL